MSAQNTAAGPRTYGGWRRNKPMGLLGFGPVGTGILLAAAIAVLGTATLSPHLIEYVVPPVIAGAGVSLIRVGGMPAGTWAWIRVRWQVAAAKDWTTYRAGTVYPLPGTVHMPGVLAATALVDAEDGRGGRFGLIWDRHTGYLTATVQVTPASPWLAEPSETDTWVAGWGSWLAGLGYVPSARWVTVTTETAPEPGTRLADATAAGLSADAPEAARQIMTAVTAAAPSAAASVATRISITFDPKRDPSHPADLAAAAAMVTRTLHGLLPGLGACGVAVDGLASAAEVTGITRAAFDPHSRGEISRILAGKREGAPVLSWADAGPVGAIEYTDRVIYDGGISAAYVMDEAPRQPVTASVLARLASPAPFPKRLTLQYRIMPAAQAARMIESEVQAAGFRAALKAKTGRDSTARDTADAARAAQAAREEAAGAGVVMVGVYVTVTVLDEADLPSARSFTVAAADASQIRVRPAWGSQSAVFAAGLPCGICPPEMARRRIK
jgi:hypothetical protein